jgi:hypothetical protein
LSAKGRQFEKENWRGLTKVGTPFANLRMIVMPAHGAPMVFLALHFSIPAILRLRLTVPG